MHENLNVAGKPYNVCDRTHVCTSNRVWKTHLMRDLGRAGVTHMQRMPGSARTSTSAQLSYQPAASRPFVVGQGLCAAEPKSRKGSTMKSTVGWRNGNVAC